MLAPNITPSYLHEYGSSNVHWTRSINVLIQGIFQGYKDYGPKTMIHAYLFYCFHYSNNQPQRKDPPVVHQPVYADN
jgi:hypothetical protein